MLNIKRHIQITLLVLVLISSTLLGLSMESPRLVIIGVFGALLGFLITDWFRWFRIEGVLANIASIVILVLAMKDFFYVDNMGKLVCVADLLVYLQTVLMFQDKKPRLNWQVLVLSLLQVVIGAIFSLNLEAGVLFLIYFGVAGLAMLFQSVYTDAFDIRRRNKRSAVALKAIRSDNNDANPDALDQPESSAADADDGEALTESGGDSKTDEDDQLKEMVDRHNRLSRPLAFFDPPESQSNRIRPMVWHLALWVAISAIFTSVLFYMVPRHTKPWFGPANTVVTSVGVSQSVDLDVRGRIEQSSRLVFRVNVERLDNGKEIPIEGNSPYFRGMALSSLVIEDGKTNWRAPHDRIFNEMYQDLRYSPSDAGFPVNQIITLEETTDPLIYGLMPFYRSPDTPKGITFCHEVSALTRTKLGENIGLAPYKYTSQTLVDSKGNFCKAWPYIANTRTFSQNPMSDDPMQWKWLTSMEPARYPELVKSANQIAAKVKSSNGSKLELMRALESYFLEANRFRYTLDFRTVERNEELDPVEDFFAGHKSGHCELYASALTLMLRQQNIPARLVVGFYGADFNGMTGNYLVREKHAHAWVEAYLEPEECTPEMFKTGQADVGGSWVILDSTPYSFEENDAGVGEEAIDLARTVWDDYVLGVDTESSENSAVFTLPIVKFLEGLDVDKWDRRFQSAANFTRSTAFRYWIAGAIFLMLVAVWIRSRFASVAIKASNPGGVAGRLRRLVAGAISLISPGLGEWVMKGTSRSNPTEFYTKMTSILSRHDLEREPSQTHREFASIVSDQFEEHPSSGLIQSTVVEVTELFNEVRFGRVELESDLSDQIKLSLNELESALSATV